MQTSKEFADLIKNERISQGISQIQIAELLGVAQSTYSRYEREDFRTTSFFEMIQLLSLLGIYPENITPELLLDAVRLYQIDTKDLFKLSGYQVETTADGGADLIQETTGKKVHLSAFDFGILTGKIIGSLQNIVDPYFGK